MSPAGARNGECAPAQVADEPAVFMVTAARPQAQALARRANLPRARCAVGAALLARAASLRAVAAPLRRGVPRVGRNGEAAPVLQQLSIIVPVWNEAGTIRAFLTHLRACAPAAEIIVVDGGSNDRSARLSEDLADRVMRAPRSRARQMNMGAAAASGDVLGFLHADSRVPARAPEAIRNALQDPRLVGGCFRLRFPRRRVIYRVSDSLGNFAVDLFRIALGDHGFFCRRSAFNCAGGFPDVPIMEDAEFYRALQGIGRTRQLHAEIETSPRRYEELGPYRTTAMYGLILALYFARVPLSALAGIHSRFISRRRSTGAVAFPPPIYERSFQT